MSVDSMKGETMNDKDKYDFTYGERRAVISVEGKTRITMMIDNDVLAAFRDSAKKEKTGYQTLINRTLRAALFGAPRSMYEREKYEHEFEELLRRVIREEIKPKKVA